MATLHVEPLPDPAHADLAPYATLRRRKDLERSALFVVEGDKVVLRLLESDYPVESLLVTPTWLERLRGRLEARPGAVRVFLAEDQRQIEAVAGFRWHQGVMAVGRIPHAVTLEEALAGAARPRLLAALDGVSNAENLGVVVRNAAALGVQALIVGERSCSPFLTRAIRTSMGAVFRLPCVEHAPLLPALGGLRAAGVRCVAAHPGATGASMAETDLRQDVCLVLGSEGEGISAPVLAVCDAAAAVPMARGIDSLNVGSAAAVCFYEARRQRSGRA